MSRSFRMLRWLACISSLLLPCLTLAGQPNVWVPQTSNTNRTLSAVAYGDGTFVAVGDYGTILTSLDGSSWTARASPTTRGLRGVAYDAWFNLFVAVGDVGTIVVSDAGSHGATWSVVAPPTGVTENLRSVTTASQRSAGGGMATQIVAVGGARVLRATYPYWWTDQTLPAVNGVTPSLQSVASNGEQMVSAPNSNPILVAVGTYGHVFRSTDGITWTRLNCGTPGDLRAVSMKVLGVDAFTAVGMLYASTRTTQNIVSISGTSCTVQAAPSAYAEIDALTRGAIADGNDYGVAVGYGQILVTPFGTSGNWAIVATGTSWLQGVAYGNGRYVAVGASGTIYLSGSALYPYQGCFSDDEGRALPVMLMPENATVETCAAAAKTRLFAYAGLQSGGQCFAGNVLGHVRTSDETKCGTSCTAAPGEKCGGTWFNSIYATGIVPSAPRTGTYVGCFTDSSQRALPVQITSSGATVESCVTAAYARGLRYAGLQFYGQCFAGNTLGYTQVADPNHTACNTKCDANQNEYCGGAWLNSVYDTGTPTPPAVPPSSSRGCWSDDGARALPVSPIPTGATVESCVAAARAMGFAYAGLQDHGQCFAGNVLGRTQVADTNHATCNARCDANPTEWCGGSWLNSIWSTQ